MNPTRNVFLVLLLLTASVFSQEKPTLGVMDVTFLPKITDDAQRELYTSTVRGRVIDLVRDSVDIIEGSKLERMIQVNAASCNTSSCLAQFAKTIGVDYLLGTHVISHKGTWSASVSLASSRSSSLLSEKVADYGSEAELRKGLADLVSQAVKSLTKSGGGDISDNGGNDQSVVPPPAGAKKVIVAFVSDPAGAAVTVDGNFLCTTPCSKMVLQGDHRIGMGKDGFRQKKDVVRAERNNQSLSWNLEAISTRLSLTAVDDRTGNDLVGDVYVDGTKVGQTPFDGLVAVGAQKIEVSAEGFDRQTVSVTLEEGNAANATAHFRSVEKPKVVESPNHIGGMDGVGFRTGRAGWGTGNGGTHRGKMALGADGGGSSFTDSRDSQIYGIVTIGSQTWMAQNLNYQTENSWCYDNSASNCQKYGRLYVWQTARSACPEGWHLPSDQEWSILESAVGSDAGKKLKSSSSWDGTNAYGFSLLPSGRRVDDGSFNRAGSDAYFWSSSEDDLQYAWGRDLNSGNAVLYRDYYYMAADFSVRCLKD